MASLAEIYEALAGLDVAINGSTVPVRYLSALPDTVTAAGLPLRLLLPTPPQGTDVDSFTIADFGSKNAVVDWRVTDLMLLAPTRLGEGLGGVAATLSGYAQAYLDAIRANHTLGLTATGVLKAQVDIRPFEYPSYSDHWYYGVAVVLTIRTYLTGE